MIKRTIETKFKELLTKFRVVFLTGPRQSGKTTLCKYLFPEFSYVSLENLDQRDFANQDPRGFLDNLTSAKGIILDEAQRTPNIFSYLQTYIDNKQLPPLILTGSQQFHLSTKINQSLAGRAALLELYPFSLSELLGKQPQSPNEWDKLKKDQINNSPILTDILFSGTYPPIHDRKLPARDWLNGYVKTYIERDIRELINIGDLETFSRFLRLCAGRSAQLLNLSSLASDTGISHTTARRWISILRTSGIVLLLNPYHKNYSKQMIKSPKLYFLDSGLICFLLNIRSANELFGHPLCGSIFETFTISEVFKMFTHIGENAPIFFWRDRGGHEIDLIIDLGSRFIPVEIKFSQTLPADAFKSLRYFLDLSQTKSAVMVYGGKNEYIRPPFTVKSWLSV